MVNERMFYKETDFRETPVGRIPKGWNLRRLCEIAEVDAGGNAPQGEEYFKNGKHPFIRVQHFDGDRVYVDRWDLVNDDAIRDYRLRKFPKDAIVFPKSGASINLEKRAMLPFDSYVVGHLCVLVPNTKIIDNRFLFYMMKRTRFSRNSAGTTLPYLNLEYVSRVPIPLPSLGEQQAIVKVLSVVDLAVAKTGEVIAKTERLKKGLMQTLLTRGIGHKEYKQTPIGTTPKEWRMEKIGNVCKVVTGGTPSTRHPEYFGGNIKWLKSGDIKKLYIYDTEEKITQLGVENSNAKIHPANSVAIALSGRGQTRGRTTIIKEPMACSQSVAIMIPSPELIPEYLHYNLSNRYLEIRNLTGHLDRSGLNLSIVSDIQIPIPSVGEQEQIASILTTVDRKVELERDEKARLERIKRGLMDLLLTGKIRIKVD